MLSLGMGMVTYQRRKRKTSEIPQGREGMERASLGRPVSEDCRGSKNLQPGSIRLSQRVQGMVRPGHCWRLWETFRPVSV